MSAVIEPQIVLPVRKKGRNRWIYGSLAVAIVLGGSAIAYIKMDNHTISVPVSDLYTVGYGSVTQTVSATGTVQAPEAVNLSFTGASGVISTLPVQVGQTVQPGQIVATLEDASQQIAVTTAKASLQQAQGNLVQAQAKLAQVQEPPTAPTLAVARAAVAKARSTLAGARLQYQDQLAIYNNRSSAQSQLLSAQNSVTEEAAAVEAARINLQKAKLEEQESENGGTPQDISVLRDEVTVAEQAITSADQELSLAQQNLSITQQTLQAAEQTLSTDVQNSASAAQIQADESAVRQAQQSYNSGESAVIQSETSLTNAQSGLVTAEKNLADAQPASNTTDAQLATNAVTTAQVQLQQAQIQYSAAKQNLLVNKAVYNDRLSAKQSVDNAANAVQQDQIGLQSATASLQETEQPPDPATIEADQAAVLSAQAAVQSAQAQIESAQLGVQNTVLRSPIAGVVTAISGEPGEALSGSGPVVTINENTGATVTLNIQVPESEIGSVKAGEAISATATAYPTDSFTGEIAQVYPMPQVVSDVTEYTVMATLSDPHHQLLTGMTTNVSIDTQTAKHTIVVPALSLTQLGSIEGVYVLNSGKGKRSAASFAAYFHHHGGKGGSFSGFGGGGFSGGGGTTGFSGGAGSASGGSSTAFAGGGGTSAGTFGSGGGSGGFRSALQTPYGNQVRFQPVTVGLFGTSTVQVTAGLTPGEQILLVPPSSAASAASGTSSTGRGFGGGGFGGGFAGGFGHGGFGG